MSLKADPYDSDTTLTHRELLAARGYSVHRWSDLTNDAIADGDWVVSFRCQRCGEWLSITDHDARCHGEAPVCPVDESKRRNRPETPGEPENAT